MITARREILGMGAAGLKNAYHVDGKRYGGRSKYTVYELARDLLADGHAWDQNLRIVDPDGVVVLTGSLSEMARWSIVEDENGLSRRRYRPHRFAQIARADRAY